MVIVDAYILNDVNKATSTDDAVNAVLGYKL